MTQRSHFRLTLTVAVALAACSRGEKVETAKADSLTRDLQLAPLDTTARLNDRPAIDSTPVKPTPAPTPQADTTTPVARKPIVAPPVHMVEKPAKPKVDEPSQPRPAAVPVPSAFYTADAGTRIEATAPDSMSTRQIKPPYAFSAPVTADVLDKNGHVVIPAGSLLRIRITEFAPAPNKSAKDGKLAAILLKVTVNGVDYRPNATIDSIDHILKGRGIGAGEVAKAGGGAAAGAVIGGLIGKGKGAVIGGLLGAAGGTAVAVETADRDVVIPAGGVIHLSLRDSLQVPTK